MPALLNAALGFAADATSKSWSKEEFGGKLVNGFFLCKNVLLGVLPARRKKHFDHSHSWHFSSAFEFSIYFFFNQAGILIEGHWRGHVCSRQGEAPYLAALDFAIFWSAFQIDINGCRTQTYIELQKTEIPVLVRAGLSLLFKRWVCRERVYYLSLSEPGVKNCVAR